MVVLLHNYRITNQAPVPLNFMLSVLYYYLCFMDIIMLMLLCIVCSFFFYLHLKLVTSQLDLFLVIFIVGFKVIQKVFTEFNSLV